jgi:hypothetical protein
MILLSGKNSSNHFDNSVKSATIIPKIKKDLQWVLLRKSRGMWTNTFEKMMGCDIIIDDLNYQKPIKTYIVVGRFRF